MADLLEPPVTVEPQISTLRAERALRTEEMILNMGPQHPSTHGVFRAELVLDGEQVVDAIPHIGYLHRCFEKHAEAMTYPQVIPYCDRLDYCGAMNNDWGFALACEELMGVKVSEKVEYIRVIVAELNRINDVLRANGTTINEMKVLLETTLERVEELRSQRPSRQIAAADDEAGESPVKRQGNSVNRLLLFIREVVSQGHAGRPYSRIFDMLIPVGKIPESEVQSRPWRFGPTEYVVTAGQPFENPGGLHCRRVQIRYFSEGRWHRWDDQVFCVLWDRWQRM